MGRSGTEVKQVIDELMAQGFSELYSRHEERQAVLYGEHGEPGGRLYADLKRLGYKTQVALASRVVQFLAGLHVANIDRPLRIHVEPDRPSDAAKADKLEQIDAYWWHRLDDGGRTTRQILRHLVVSPYAAVWWRWRRFVLPRRVAGETDKAYNERCDRYRHEYDPFFLEVDPPDAVAFLEDQGRPTIAVRRVQKSIIDLVKDYGDYDVEDDDPELYLRVWEEQFEWVRAGYSVSERQGGWAPASKVTLWECDDGYQITHHVELESGGRKEYRMEGKAAEGWRNPIGRPTLFLAFGQYSADASRPVLRYQPLILPLLTSRYAQDLMRSTWASRSAELVGILEELPPEVSREVATWDAKARNDFMAEVREVAPNAITRVMGRITELARQVDPLQDRLYAEEKELEYLFRPPNASSERTLRFMERATASAVLNKQQIDDRIYKEPVAAYVALVKDILEACNKFYKPSPVSYVGNKPGVSDDQGEKAYAVLTGREPAVQTVQKGTRLEIGPSVFDFPYTLEVTVEQETAASRAAAREEALSQYTAPGGPYITSEAMFEKMAGVSNVSEYAIQVEADVNYEMHKETFRRAAQVRAMRALEFEEGVNLSELIALIEQGGQPGLSRGRAAGGGGGTFRPPPVQQVEVSSGGPLG